MATASENRGRPRYPRQCRLHSGNHQEIWKDHPEKVLGTTAEWVAKYPNNRPRHDHGHPGCVEVHRRSEKPLCGGQDHCEKSYVNTDFDSIEDRMLGQYDNAMARNGRTQIT